MAGYRQTFGENLNFAYQGGSARGRDLTSTLQGGMASLGNIRGQIAQARQAQAALGRETQRLADLMEIEKRSIDKNTKAYAELSYRINQTKAGIDEMKKSMRSSGLDMMEKSLGGLTKKLISFNTSLLSLGFDFLISSITRVYELQEKWTKAIGGFNMKLGGMTAGLKSATRAAGQWSSTMRGLTNGDIQEGIEMFGDFTLAVGKVGTALNFQKWGLEAARGFGLGAEGAGQLAKVLNNIGDSGDDATRLFGHTLVSAAQAADVPITMLAKDIQESSTYLARFGKEGQKTFVQGAAWARKFTISMQQLRGAVEGFDMFDDAAKTASKLNTAFGTMINSMDLMMEDDPAKRMEMIRQQFLAQGKTFDTLAPKQRRYLAETLKLTEDQVAALLDVKNANMSYSDFKAKEAAKEKQEVNAKRNMELMLRKTTQTMYAFGAAFDRITVAIANAIQPLLRVFGLATDGNKKFKNFGQVMESITTTVEAFFNSLGEGQPNADKWQSFMRTLATDLMRAGRALKDFVMSGRAASLVGELADTMKNFYTWVRDLGIKALPYIDKLGKVFLFLAQNVDKLAYAWAGVKGLSMLGGQGGLLGGMSKAASGAKGLWRGGEAISLKGYSGGIGSRLGSAGIGMAAGGMLGGTGATIGGGLGGLLGPLGGLAGAAIGKAAESLLSYFTKDDEMEDSTNRLKTAQQKAAMAAERNAVFTDKASLTIKKLDLDRQRGDRAILELQKGKQFFEIQDKKALIDRVRQLQGFGKQTDLTAAALNALQNDGKLSKDMLNALKQAGDAYNLQLNDLSKQTQTFLQLQQEKMGFEADEIKAAIMKNKQAAVDLEINELKRQREAVGGISMSDVTGGGAQSKLVKLQEIDAKIRDAQLKKNDIGIGIEKQQAKTLDKQLALDMKRYQLESLNRNTDFMKFMETAKAEGRGGLGENELAKQFLMQNPAAAAEMMSALGGKEMYQKVVFGMAGGGVVTRPTHAMIGEAGPEAVIPLRSMARGRMGMPTKHGGQAATNMVNYATGGGGQQGRQVVASTAEIHLDGQKVGRALVRTLITAR